MLRTAALLCLLLAPAAWAKAPETHQFIDFTRVEVPKVAGAYVLDGTQYDAKSFYVGVSTHWSRNDAPSSLKLDVFVYPSGRQDEKSAVAGSMGEVEAALAEGTRQGIYAKVEPGGRTPFVVVRPEPSVLDDGKKKARPAFDPTPKPEVVATPSGASADDPLIRAITESVHSPNSHGLRQAISFEREGESWRSAAFVFYRNLFLFKVRISVPAKDMTQEAFDRLADDAARQLVPRIDVQNFGECGTIAITPPPTGASKDQAGQETGEQMIRGMARISDENCANSPGKKDATPAGVERVVIEYPEGTWKGGE